MEIKDQSLRTADFNDRQKRNDLRYPCVGIPLLYCDLNDSEAKEMSEKLYQADVLDMSLSGLSFDIGRFMQVGEKLMVLFKNHGENKREQISTQIRWCRKLMSGRYRVGVSIDTSQPLKKNQCIGAGESPDSREVPSEIDSLCPACKQQSIFQFLAFQPVLVSKGVLPLYNCLACGTTRSFLGLLNWKEKAEGANKI